MKVLYDVGEGRLMKYIGQIFTGGWNIRNYPTEDIIERLKVITAKIPLEKVIIGWNTDPEIYRKTGEWLHANGIKMLLWLPVFSETGELRAADEALDIFQKPAGNLALQEGENFTFYCPSSERNIQNVFDIYEEYFSGCGFDGVFLDKIRSQSFVSGIGGVLSCCCPRCEAEYAGYGVSLKQFQASFEEKKDRIFDSSGYAEGKGFVYVHPETENYFAAKEKIIAASVSRICRYFKERNLETGLDLYAPLLSRTVGQNYAMISKDADFIKPMMYRRTDAPAGIGYEYAMMKNAIPDAEGYGILSADPAFLEAQLNEFGKLPVKKYPGIEVNYREDIARTDADYIRESLQICQKCGMDGVVLAWDLMLAPDSHLEAAAGI